MKENDMKKHIVSILNADNIRNPAAIAIHAFHKMNKGKLTHPASHFNNPHAAKQFISDLLGRYGLKDQKTAVEGAKSFDDIQEIGQSIMSDQRLKDKIMNAMAKGIAYKDRAKEWNQLNEAPKLIVGGQYTDIERNDLDPGKIQMADGGGEEDIGYGGMPVGGGAPKTGGSFASKPGESKTQDQGKSVGGPGEEGPPAQKTIPDGAPGSNSNNSDNSGLTSASGGMNNQPQQNINDMDIFDIMDSIVHGQPDQTEALDPYREDEEPNV